MFSKNLENVPLFKGNWQLVLGVKSWLDNSNLLYPHRPPGIKSKQTRSLFVADQVTGKRLEIVRAEFHFDQSISSNRMISRKLFDFHDSSEFSWICLRVFVFNGLYHCKSPFCTTKKWDLKFSPVKRNSKAKRIQFLSMFKIKWQTSLPNGCFRKWWYPQNTPKWSFLVGKRMVVGYHHFRKPPNGTCFFVVVCCWPPKISSQNRFCLFCYEFYPPWNSWILKVGLFSFLGKAFRAMFFLGSELVYLPRTKLSSIFEGQPSKTRPFSISTRVIWVCVWKFRKQAYHIIIMEFSSLLPPKSDIFR